MIDECMMKKAIASILPQGYKPEDYAVVGSDYAVKVAILVAEEYRHLLWLRDNASRRYRSQHRMMKT